MMLSKENIKMVKFAAVLAAAIFQVSLCLDVSQLVNQEQPYQPQVGNAAGSSVRFPVTGSVYPLGIRGCLWEVSKKKPAKPRLPGSSVLFPLTGNVYPLGYYSVDLNIGTPSKKFDFDIDTGSNLTWVQCDASCTGCTKPRDQHYKPVKENYVPCEDPLCHAIKPPGFRCKSPLDRCDFKVDYADQGSVIGVLVRDYFTLELVNGAVVRPHLVFGCAYHLKHGSPHQPPPTVGVLGLGKGKASIVSQLQALGLVENVIGHCFSELGGGYLFFGNYFVPRSGVTWTPMSPSSSIHYSSGPADLIFHGEPTDIRKLKLVFDTGASYTYFNSPAYEGTLDLIKKNLIGKPIVAVSDPALPVCWKGPKPFRSIKEAVVYFKPLAMSFTNARNVRLHISPKQYLILTGRGNVCLGILNGGQHVGLGNLHVVGDIFMQDRLVIYNNEKHLIGWAPGCNFPHKL